VNNAITNIFSLPDAIYNYLEYDYMSSFIRRGSDHQALAHIKLRMCGQNEQFYRIILNFLLIFGNIGGILGVFAPLLGIIVGAIAEHEFLIKFLKLSFLTRELDNAGKVNHKVIQLTCLENFKLCVNRNFCACFASDHMEVLEDGEERLEGELDVIQILNNLRTFKVVLQEHFKNELKSVNICDLNVI
jgi:hypothetical protein